MAATNADRTVRNARLLVLAKHIQNHRRIFQDLMAIPHSLWIT